MIRSIQNSFVSGEIAPHLYGRHDLKAYFSGAQRVENFTVRKSGGLRKRPGTDIAMDLTAYAAGRILPFFYDRTGSTLILIHNQTARFIVRQPDGALGFVQAAGADYTVAVPWLDGALPSLRHYQLGDTLYLSAPGYQAAKLVRLSDASWELSYLTGLTAVAAPAALSATASGFEASDIDATVDYALFAKKNGVNSLPKKRSASIKLPWPAGAKVSLSWTPDLASGIDGYVLGKKTGAYYGLLAECFPTRDPISLTSKTWSSSGAATAAPANTHAFSADHAAALRATDPNATATYELKLYRSNFCYHLPRPTSGAAPYVEFTPSSAAAIGKVGVWFGAVAANATKQDTVSVSYAAGVGILFQRWTGTAWTAGEAFTVYPGTATDGYAEITIADTTSTSNKRRLTFTGLDAADTGLLSRGIAVYNRAGTPALVAGTFALAATAAYAFSCRGLSGWTSLAADYAASTIDVTADTLARGALAEVSCVPKRYLTAHATPMALDVALDTGSYYATARLAASAVFEVSEFRLYLGADAPVTPLRTPGAKDRIPSNTLSVEIQTSPDGTTWTTLAGTYAVASQYAAEPLSVMVPAGTYTDVKAWGLRIKAATNAPVVLRGVSALYTTIQSSFVDQNHVPTTLIDSQRYIEPGESDMAVDLVAMHQQRLVLAACDARPFTLWFSKTGEIEMWYASSPIADDDPFAATIPATRASRIRAMLGDRHLLLFTDGGIYAVEAGSDGFSYRTARIDKICSYGIGTPQPVAGANTVLFVSEDNRTLYELRYDLTQDSLIPLDRSVLSAHLTEASPIARLAWSAAPDATLWSALDDGSLLAFTYMPEHEVYAWSRHRIAGVDRILDIISTGAVDERQHAETTSQLYLLAECGPKTYLLAMRPTAASDAPSIHRAACLDLAQAIHITATGEVSGFEPLGSGAVEFTPPHPYPDGTAGIVAVNLDTGALTAMASGLGTPGCLAPVLAAGDYLLGVPVSATLHTLRPELPDRNIQGLRKNIADTVLRLHRARAVTAAPLSDPAVTAVTETTPAAALAAGLCPLADADIKLMPYGLLNHDGRLAVTSPDPWPCEILSVITTINLEDLGLDKEDQR